MLKYPTLVADIGGTNARFCLLENAQSKPVNINQVKVADYPDLFAALESAYQSAQLKSVATIICAIAGPSDGAGYALTNADWKFLPEEMKSRLGVSNVLLMNDFSAQAASVLALENNDLKPLTENPTQNGKPKLVVGPGTGLGVANLFEFDGKHYVSPGEGGHMDIGARTDREAAIWKYLDRSEGRVSGENVLSGSGLENIFQAILKADGAGGKALSAPDISANFDNGDLPQAKAAIELFVTLLGRITGDLALVNLSTGGVYLGGGISAKLPFALFEHFFMPAFLDKAPHQDLMSEMPVHLVHHPNAAIEGLAYFANSFNTVSIGSMIASQ